MTKQWQKFITKLKKEDKQTILLFIENILQNEDSTNLKKMNGYENRFRARFGKIRLIFEKNSEGILKLIKIGNRGDIYKK